MTDTLSPAPVDVGRIFAAEGLPTPPIPAGFPLPLRQWGDWVFATAEPSGNPWDIDGYVAAAGRDASPFMLVSHSGYGMNSAAIHYVLVWRGLGLFLQVPWGGAYTDDAEATATLVERFGEARALIDAAARSLAEGERLFAVDSIAGGRWARAGGVSVTPGWVRTPTPFADALQSLTGMTSSRTDR